MFLQPIVEPDRNNEKETFKMMLGSKEPVYLKRTADMIINWQKEKYNSNIYHIHGDNDHTIPIRNVVADIVLPNGSHMMALTRGEEIGGMINQILFE